MNHLPPLQIGAVYEIKTKKDNRTGDETIPRTFRYRFIKICRRIALFRHEKCGYTESFLIKDLERGIVKIKKAG